MTDEKPWLNGKPYYCVLCGFGGAEYMACEMPDCTLETEADAQARQRIHAQMAPVNITPS